MRDLVELLGGISCYVRPGQRVLVKPNFLSNDPPEAAVNAHPAVVAAVVQLVREAGGDPLIGDSPGVWNLEKTADRIGIGPVAHELGVPVVNLADSVEVKNPRDDAVFKKIEIAKAALEADVIISVPKLKTHQQMLLTLGVKNVFGCVVGKRKAQWHLRASTSREIFARMLVELYAIVRPSLTVVDGILAMQGWGPAHGTPRHLGLLLAGVDCVALDSTICRIVGVDPSDLPVVKAAREMGVGVSDSHAIQVEGCGLADVRVPDFDLPHCRDVMFGPRLLRPYLKSWFTPKPRVRHRICKRCEICVGACPPQAMELVNGRVRIDHGKCIRCFCCDELCPEGAVKIARGPLSRLLR